MNRDRPFGGAYDNFPKDPQAYQNGAAEPALKTLFDAAVLHAEDRIAWYGKKGARQARFAKRIRFFSLLLFALGTLAPILATVVGKLTTFPWAEVGYVLLALAGALVVFDQFFDASGSWIRVRRTEALLQVMLADFRFAWAELLTKYGGIPAEQLQRAEIAALVRNFVKNVEVCAETETGEWAQRFSQRIESFDGNPNLRGVSLGRDDKRRDGRAGSGSHDAASRRARGASGNGEKWRADGAAGPRDRDPIRLDDAAGRNAAETDRGQAAGAMDVTPMGGSK